MSERVDRTVAARHEQSDEELQESAASHAGTTAVASELDESTETILAEIDKVIAETTTNIEEFLQNFKQKGGE